MPMFAARPRRAGMPIPGGQLPIAGATLPVVPPPAPRSNMNVQTLAPSAIPKTPNPAIPPGDFTPASILNQYNAASEGAKSTNEFRYDDILKQYDALKTGGAAAYGDFANQQLSDFKASQAPVLQGMNDRYTRNMKDLEGAGQQEASDIRDSWASQGANAQQDLTARGLGGTTIMPTMKQGIQRQQNNDLGRLNERVRQQRIDTDSRLSGDALGALSAFNQTYADAAKNYGNQNFAFQTGVTKDALNFQERRDDVGPDFGQYAQLAMKLGAGGATVPGGSAATGAGAGGPAGGGAGGAGAPGSAVAAKPLAPYMNKTVGGSMIDQGNSQFNIGMPGLGTYKGTQADAPTYLTQAWADYMRNRPQPGSPYYKG